MHVYPSYSFQLYTYTIWISSDTLVHYCITEFTVVRTMNDYYTLGKNQIISDCIVKWNRSMREKTYDSIQKLKRVRKSTETQIKQLHYCSKNHCKLDRHFPVYETHSDGNSVSVFMLQFYTLSKGYVMCILNVASTVKESPIYNLWSQTVFYSITYRFVNWTTYNMEI